MDVYIAINVSDIIYMGVLFASMSVLHVHAVSMESRKSDRAPGIAVANGPKSP